MDSTKGISQYTQALLQTYQLCDAMHALPEAGGLYDQDCHLVMGFQIVQAAVSERAKKDADRNKP